ncbi:MAG: OsmC family protein [Gemmatimonadota bacterium]
MLGTLNGVLEARGIFLANEDITADVEGVNEIRDRLPVLTRIVVRYHLNIPAGSRETVERSLERHASKCPTASSLSGAVEVEWEAQITESEDGRTTGS